MGGRAGLQRVMPGLASDQRLAGDPLWLGTKTWPGPIRFLSQEFGTGKPRGWATWAVGLESKRLRCRRAWGRCCGDGWAATMVGAEEKEEQRPWIRRESWLIEGEEPDLVKHNSKPLFNEKDEIAWWGMPCGVDCRSKCSFEPSVSTSHPCNHRPWLSHSAAKVGVFGK